MRFAAAQHIEVATQLSALWVAVSLAAQSILGHLPVDVSQAGVVGEMVVRFWERAEWCSRLETSGVKVCDLVLGLVDGRVHLVTHLEEVIERLRVMRDEHEALWSSATRVWGSTPGRSDEMPSLAVALSPSTKLIEGCVNAAAINGVHWGPQMVLTAVLSHFPELESELELLGSGYNADLMKDEMEAF
jgi:hypothetical protein